MASSAPKIHPNIAWGPPMVASMRGMVMNGPTPTTLEMLSAVACSNPKPRVNWVCDGEEISVMMVLALL